jgi:hypothetical protein
VLPWLVIDRTTNQECSRSGRTPAATGAEARRLATAAQESLDAVMHRHRMMAMIPRKEWQPQWQQYQPGQIVRQSAGCAVCTPIGALLEYDRTALQALGQAVRADYIWLGVTVVPLTRESAGSRSDDCCREALAQERRAVLARSSALLVRVRDGEVVWQRDARRLERDVPGRVGRFIRSEPLRREYGVKNTARMLGNGFAREHRRALQQTKR